MLVPALQKKVYYGCTDKKENQIFLIYKEIQNGAVANGGEGIFVHFLIY